MANKHSRTAPAPPSEAVEAEALAAWYGGDETALLGLIYHYEHRLHRFFTGKVLASDIADLVQQTWEPILDRKRDERIQNFRAFLFGVARNVLHAYRRSQRRATATDPYDSAAVEGAKLNKTDSNRKIRSMDLRDALARLPMDLRLMLELYYGEGLTAEELAPVFSIPLGTVRSRLRRAKSMVSHWLAGNDGEP